MSQQIFVKNLFLLRYFAHFAKIWLKFGTRIGGLKVNTTTNFGVNLGLSDYEKFDLSRFSYRDCDNKHNCDV